MRLVRILVLSLLLASVSSADEISVQLGEKGAGPAVIVRNPDNRIVNTVVKRLTSYLDAIDGATAQQGVTIVVGDASVAKEYGTKLPDPSSDESFTIAPVTRGDQRFIVISGSTDKGIKQAIYHLLRNISVDGEKIVLNHASTEQSPFIR